MRGSEGLKIDPNLVIDEGNPTRTAVIRAIID